MGLVRCNMKNFIVVTSKTTDEPMLVNTDFIIEIFPCEDYVVIKQLVFKNKSKFELLAVTETLGEIITKLSQMN